jgi:hypothetical protein
VRSAARRIGVFVVLLQALAGAFASAQSFPDAGAAPLDVPFLAQSELLCGGAAGAMIERFFGRRGVYAEDFASLVRPDEGGIRTTDLAAAVRARGWAVQSLDGSAERVQQHLADKIPVIALLQVAPRRYHYVVVLSWADGIVHYHDPAIGPDRRLTEREFTRQWEGGASWMMVTLPSQATSAPSVRPAATAILTPLDDPACNDALTLALVQAGADSLVQAAEGLAAARERCPSETVLSRELGGIRFRQRRFTEAAALATRHLQRVRTDSLAWELLAASQFLAGHPEAALGAWNAVGRPVIDLVRIDGVRSGAYRRILGTLQLPHGDILSRYRLALASRRLGAMPAIARSAITYRPVAGGAVEVRVAVVEHRRWPALPWRLATEAAGALLQQEVRLEITNQLQVGERWQVLHRWGSARAASELRVAVPIDRPMPLTVGFRIGYERFRFRTAATAAPTDSESRRSTGVEVGGWMAPALHATLSVQRERWDDARTYTGASLALEARAAADRLIIRAAAAPSLGHGATDSYLQASAQARWSSTTSGIARPGWSARIGAEAVSGSAPAGTLATAGSILTYMVPLRAHAGLLANGLSATLTGRRMLHGGLAADLPVRHLGPLTLAVGAFLDGVQIGKSLDPAPPRTTYLDAGVGLRLGVAGGALGILRIDLGTGLLDRRTALTAGVQTSWPDFGRGAW